MVTSKTERLTLGQLGILKLTRLCAGVGCDDLRAPAMRAFNLMSRGWSNLPALAAPYWASDITDDGSPFEFSLSLAGSQVELRLLVEAQHLPGTVEDNWRAGLELNRSLVREYGADLARFERISQYFAPPAGEGARFALWHSAAFQPSGEVVFKAYLNPEIAGEGQASRRIEAALLDLGMNDAWRLLSEHVGETGNYIYASLDLVGDDLGRIKVYSAYDTERITGLDDVLSADGLAGSGEVASVVRRLTEGRPALDSRRVQVCYSFRSHTAKPSVTVYVPVRSHCGSDASALEQAVTLLEPDIATKLHMAATNMAGRPLEVGRGLITYVAFRPRASKPSVTVYLSPQVYSIAAPRMSEYPTANEHPTADTLVPPRESSIRALQPRANSKAVSFGVVLNAIAAHRSTLSQHPFIEHLRSANGTLEDVRRISSRVAFFVMAFQDVLRLVRQTTTDPLLEDIAKTHELEDKGHDRWYLQDLERLGVTLSVRDLFSADMQSVRDVAYNQISDVLRTRSDCSRLAVVMALEAAGAEFFGTMIPFIMRQKSVPGLLYFARRHQQVEEGHDVFTDDGHDKISSITVNSDDLSEVLGVVDRTFDTMFRLADNLLEHVGVARGQLSELREGAA